MCQRGRAGVRELGDKGEQIELKFVFESYYSSAAKNKIFRHCQMLLLLSFKAFIILKEKKS
jgi:hypothetical protein